MKAGNPPRGRILLLLAFILFAPFACAGGRPAVTILLSGQDGLYDELAGSFVQAIGPGYASQVRDIDTLNEEQFRRLDQEGTLIVPVGMKATGQILGLRPGHATVLSLLVSRAAFESMTEGFNAKDRVSAVYIDQPLSRSLALIRLMLPDAHRVGMLQSADTAGQLDAYRQQAARQQFSLLAETIDEASDVPEALQRLLPGVDAFLLLADSSVVNSSTVRYILLANYRQQIPVIGFSRGMVKAGAVAAVVSDPDAIARQGGQMVRQWRPETGAIPAPTSAGEFTLVFNYPVARSLGLTYPVDGRALNEWRRAIGD